MNMSPDVLRKACYLSRIDRFSRGVLNRPLYDYQLQPLTAVLDSVYRRRGLEFLLVFSRQSGKNEAVAHLLVYLLNVYRRRGGNMVFAAIGDGLGRGQRRLHERLNNLWNQDEWRKAAGPTRTILGRSAVVFISSHPQAAARGETADHLLVVDELQDQDPLYVESVFTPMRAANNATAVYLGTVRSRHDALWRKKEELERLQAADKVQRVFWAGPQQVMAANPQYERFLQAQVARHGRYHPIIASEYFLEPLDGGGGLFPARRLALMRGLHERRQVPEPALSLPKGGEGSFIALLDVGGQDEAATAVLAQLANPARDYTVCTIVEVRPAGDDEPVYHALDVFVDQGARFFEASAEGGALAERLQAADKVQRVFWAGPQQVMAANPQYERFLQAQVARHGRYHPIIASEYFLEPLDGGGGLFPARRLALMRGRHQRRQVPKPALSLPKGGEGSFIALLDVGGQDEAATAVLAQLANPARDYTVCTIVEVRPAAGDDEPVYHALDVFVDQGARFFEASAEGGALAERLLAYLEGWGILHLVADATGVGEGLAGWLCARLGRDRVTEFKFTRGSKAALGAAFLSLVETGRFKYWRGDEDRPGSDGWWFWQQGAHCIYDLPPGGLLQRDLRWYVPESARVSTPQGMLPVHDDRLLSAALVAEFDRLLREGKVLLGDAKSAVLPSYDPLSELDF